MVECPPNCAICLQEEVEQGKEPREEWDDRLEEQ